MNDAARFQIANIILALSRVAGDPFADEKFRFSEALMSSASNSDALRRAVPKLTEEKLYNLGIYPTAHWPSDELVIGFCALISAACPELIATYKLNLIRKLMSEAEHPNTLRRERVQLLIHVARTLNSIPDRPAK